MPHDADHLTLPDDLRAALDATVDPASREEFVNGAVRAAVRRRALAARTRGMGIEPWWPLGGARFALLACGDLRLDDDGEE